MRSATFSRPRWANTAAAAIAERVQYVFRRGTGGTRTIPTLEEGPTGLTGEAWGEPGFAMRHQKNYKV